MTTRQRSVYAAWRWLLAAVACGLAIPPASACGPYEVALYEFGSMYCRNPQGQRVGIDPDVIDEVSRRTGCQFKTFVDSRVRIWTALAEGRLDMTVSGMPTPERQEQAEFIAYLYSRNYLIVHKVLAPRLVSLEAFEADPKLRLGVVRGFRHGQRFDAWIQRLTAAGRVSEVADAEVLARVFAAGRVDGFLSQPLAWRPLLARNQLEHKVSKLDLAPNDGATGGLVLSRQRVREADAALMRQAVQAMRADGTLEAILARHVEPKLARDVAREP